jgi:mRNA interferase MazF
MKPFQRGQVWLVNFDPSVGHEYQKVRPALIIQQNLYMTGSPSLLTVIPISSQVTKRSELDLLVTPDSQNRLMKASLLKTKQISSFDRRRFIKYIGTLNDDLLHQLERQLQQFLFGKIFSESIVKTNTTGEEEPVLQQETRA